MDALLDPFDVAMMTAELLSSPMHVGALLVLSPPGDAGPDYVDELFSEALAASDPIDPRLRRYPYRGLDTGGFWVWRDADIDMREHCRRCTVPPGPNGLWRLIGDLHAERLDWSGPMWTAYLIDGLDDGRFAFYVKIHHTVIDGVGGIRMIADALSTDPNRRSMPAFYGARQADSPPPPPPTKAAPTVAGGVLSRLPAPLRSVASAAGAAAGLIEQVVAGQISVAVDSVVGHTTVLPVVAPYSRFNGRPGSARVFAAGGWPRERIRAVQRAAGVTGGDVVTAMIAGVLRSWLLDRAELPKQSLVAICPITVRSREPELANGKHGNMFGAWLCPLGTNVEDPVARLDLIHRSMAEGKDWVAKRGSAASLLTVAASMGATALLPLLPLVPKIRTGYNVPISQVPGPESELYWNGAHVEAIYPVSTVYEGQALNVTTCSYAGQVEFGYVAGSGVVPDIENLIPLTELSLVELESALGVG